MQDDAILLGDVRSEIRLDLLLDDLLGSRSAEGRSGTINAPAPVAELRDTARRLRAASQWLPLPESRLTVRQALLVTAHRPGRAGRAAWRRAGMWLSTMAMIAIVGAWSLAAGRLDPLPTSSPAKMIRLMLGKTRMASVPAQAHYALTYEFLAVRLPDTTGTASVPGTVGGLPVMLALTAAPGACAQGTRCGTFMISPVQLPRAASARFGTMRGAFGCGASGDCTLASAEMIGVFATIGQPTLRASTTGDRAGLLTTNMASLKDWVSTVTSAGQKLQAEGLLPAGLTVKDLATAAGTNGTLRGLNDSGSRGSNRAGAQNRAGADGARGSVTPDNSSPAPSAAGVTNQHPASQDRVQNGSSGGAAKVTDPGRPLGAGATAAGASGHAPQSFGGRNADQPRDRTTRGGDGDTDGAGSRHDVSGPSSRGDRGARGDDGSGRDLQDGDRQTRGAGHDDGPSPAAGGSGVDDGSHATSTGSRRDDNPSPAAGAPGGGTRIDDRGHNRTSTVKDGGAGRGTGGHGGDGDKDGSSNKDGGDKDSGSNHGSGSGGDHGGSGRGGSKGD